MQAIILAAGMGRRLKELTKNNTKCMVEVNGKTLIDRLLHQLSSKGLSRIVIVVGYEGEKLIQYIEENVRFDIDTPMMYIRNDVYDKTNNIYSLGLAKECLVEEDTLLFESDLIMEDAVIDAILDDPRDTLALVDQYESWMDGTCMRLDEEDRIIEFVPGKRFDFLHAEGCYKTVNIYKFSKQFSASYYVPFLEAYCSALGNNEYYEQVLSVIATLDKPHIRAKRLNGQKWYEIDDIQDLDIASSMFETDSERQLTMLQERYGGYWRYPKLIDFCYLVNPYFPPQKLVDEMKASFDVLLTQYPSGMRVNSLLAARNFGVHQENIVVGNGAAELIKALMLSIQGNLGIVRPTFEEYPNRYDTSRLVVYQPDNADFSYTAEDLMAYFDERRIDTLLLINPDNPSGNYIPYHDLMRVLAWAGKKGIHLIVDESFVDFAEEENTLIDQSLLEANPHLCVVKSISKSYGVPGLRLGVLASGNTKVIAELKKDAAIWNINSFAEFFMQILEKYKKSYGAAKKQFCAERERMRERLARMDDIRVIPSQANYFMIELTNGMTSRELTCRMMRERNMLIKDLSGKIKRGDKQYIRVAVRKAEDNDALCDALSQVLRVRR